MPAQRFLIVNADDFGQSPGVNRGIITGHEQGIVTSLGGEIEVQSELGKGSVFHDVPVPARLSAALLEWKALQEKFKGRRIMAPGGIAFAAIAFVLGGANLFAHNLQKISSRKAGWGYSAVTLNAFSATLIVGL